MRNKILIVTSITVLIILTVRLGLKRFDKYTSERMWYVENLNYELTVVVDSLTLLDDREHGLVFCQVTNGDLDREVEDQLNKRLVQFQSLRLFVFMKTGTLAKPTKSLNDFEVGDSIYVNSTKNLFSISRKGSIVSQQQLSDVLWEGMF